MSTLTPLNEVEYSIITGDSTVAEIDEAIAHCVASAQRTPIKDHLSRPNPDYAQIHAFLDVLCELRLAAQR